MRGDTQTPPVVCSWRSSWQDGRTLVAAPSPHSRSHPLAHPHQQRLHRPLLHVPCFTAILLLLLLLLLAPIRVSDTPALLHCRLCVIATARAHTNECAHLCMVIKYNAVLLSHRKQQKRVLVTLSLFGLRCVCVVLVCQLGDSTTSSTPTDIDLYHISRDEVKSFVRSHDLRDSVGGDFDTESVCGSKADCCVFAAQRVLKGELSSPPAATDADAMLSWGCCCCCCCFTSIWACASTATIGGVCRPLPE